MLLKTFYVLCLGILRYTFRISLYVTVGLVNGKIRDAKTLLKNSGLYCKKFKNPRLEETHKNETLRLRSEISRLNEKFPRPTVF